MIAAQLPKIVGRICGVPSPDAGMPTVVDSGVIPPADAMSPVTGEARSLP